MKKLKTVLDIGVWKRGAEIQLDSFCFQRALKNRCTGMNGEKEHWLDYADDKYDVSALIPIFLWDNGVC